MKSICVIVVVVLVALLASMAFAQVPAAPVSANQLLADAVKAAEAAKDFNAALAASMKLEDSSDKDYLWAVNARELPNLLAKTGKVSDAEAWVKTKAADFAAGNDSLSAYKGYRSDALVNACYDVAGLETDPARKADIARLGLSISPTGGGTFNVLFSALVASGKPDDALQACLDYAGKAYSMESMRRRRMTLLASLKRTDDLRAEAVEYLKVATDPAASANALSVALPANDASLCCGLTAQQVLDGYKLMLRGKDARLNAPTLLKLADQLTKGGDDRPLVVTDEAKVLAGKLAGSPVEKFIVPLLTGDYASAIKEGYARAKGATGDTDYVNWVNATAGAIRCMDQHYNGRALDFIKFLNGTAGTNPVAEMVGK